MNAFKYLAAYIPVVLVFIALMLGSWWTFLPVLILFGLFPILELFMHPSAENLSPQEQAVSEQNGVYNLIIYLLVPMQYGLLVFFLFQMSSSMPNWERFGMIFSMGLACGIIGINAAHELGHRNSKFEQVLSKLLLLSSLYMHFFIEHNRGHHKHVSTAEDPASSKYGEPIYFFWLRSIIYSYLSAWKLEKTRLAIIKKPFFSLHNEMLRFQVFQLLLLTTLLLFFGFNVMTYFIAAAFIGILLLETVNYIEHYGLQRKKVNGKYERTLPIHSWNSNHPLGRIVLFELSRHSDHHYISSRKYQVLRHHDHSPQMPTGYPGMMLLALVPPLWFKVMHQKIHQLASEVN